MKLLADQPAVDVEEPPHRPVLAILGGVVVLVLMIGVGLVLLLSGNSSDQEPVTAADESLQDTADMDRWTASASGACRAMSGAPLLASGESSLAEVDQSVRSLVVAIREIPMPPDREARALILPIVLLGDETERAWSGISALDQDEVPESEIGNANSLTQAFVTGLVDIGADCSLLAAD